MVEDDEIDPINIRMSQALDRRFARFDFASDNSPQSEGGSVAINGSVAFGIRHQTSPSGRMYTISIRGAFLEIIEHKCRFERNMDLQEKVQKGALIEKSKSTEHDDREVGLNVNSNANQKVIARDWGVKGSLTGKYKRKLSDENKTELQYELFRVRWEAGGCRFGDSHRGDPYSPDGTLKGVFLNGTWGHLIPNRAELMNPLIFA